ASRSQRTAAVEWRSASALAKASVPGDHRVVPATSSTQSPKPFVATDPHKQPDEFRDYGAEARATVKEFYRLNHTHQTLDFVLAKNAEYLPRRKANMGVWEALESLRERVDDSDPDTDLPQIEHALQTAEAIRRDGHPRWLILTGLIHDLGKVLSAFGE